MIAIVSNYGRLGNQLWTYSNVLAYCIDKKITLVNTSFKQYEKEFPLSQELAGPAILRTHFAKKILDIAHRVNNKFQLTPFLNLPDGESLDMESDESFHHVVESNRIVFISGLFFLAPNSLNTHAETIRNLFKPRNRVINRIDKLLSNEASEYDLLIGVHIRHGDYKTYCDGVMFYSIDEYVSVMRALEDLFFDKKVLFLVCSDEQLTRETFRGLKVTIGVGGLVEDLYSLARCDYIIGPNSSYSQWASFYGNVPIHIMDWKCVLRYGESRFWGDRLITKPDIKDFSVIQPREFFRFDRPPISASILKKVYARK